MPTLVGWDAGLKTEQKGDLVDTITMAEIGGEVKHGV